MKPLITPVIAMAVLVGGNIMLSPASVVPDPKVSDFAFDPAKVRQNICGPIGSKRGSLFRPDVVQLLSNAANASDQVSGAEEVPLFEGLDHRQFPISSDNPSARAYFQQGFALLYAFNHWEAIRAFKKAQTLDPDCAICFWGEAIALGPNINAPMDEKSGELALAAIARAGELKTGANAREAALIEAALTRYSAGANLSRTELDQRYASAMAAVHAAYPADQDIATLYAEALMDTAPWDYWERDFATPKPHIKTAIDTIEAVLDVNPEHYGSIHLYIHLYEASNMAQKAAPYADKLAGLAPGSGHLVHMPGHIYFRIGRYLDSLETNIKAVAVDEAYLEATSGSPLYRYGYYPHNVHFILVSAQMAEDGRTSLEYAKKLDSLIPAAVLAEAEWIAPIKAAPYFAYAQFGDVETATALPDPGDNIPYLKAMWHYARGIAFAEAGDPRAETEKQAIDAMLGLEKITSAGIPAATILELASTIIEAKYKVSQHEYDVAISLLEHGVTQQDSMGYTEPPF